MIFNFIRKAKEIFFDDSTAKTGSNNVQGAIDKNSADIKTLSAGLSANTAELNKIKPVQTMKSFTKQIPSGSTEIGFSELGLTETSYGMYLVIIRGGSSLWSYLGVLEIANVLDPTLDSLVAHGLSVSVVNSTMSLLDKKAFKVTTNNGFNAIYSVLKIAG